MNSELDKNPVLSLKTKAYKIMHNEKQKKR